MPGGASAVKALGVLMVLGSAGYWCLFRYRESLQPIRLGRALLNDLAIFRYQIQTCRTPLPELLEEMEGPGADRFWRPLRERLDGENTLSWCWNAAASELPEPLGRILAPLGNHLSVGGARLDEAVEETREELTGFLREEAARQADQGRIHAALCLSGTCLAVLVLL